MKRPSTTVVLATVTVILALSGGAVGYRIGQLWSQGMMIPWQRLADVPGGATKVVGGDVGTVFVQSADGRYFSCSLSSETCWASVGGSEVPGESQAICDNGLADYTIAEPPQTPVGYLQTRQCYSEGGVATDYVVLTDGSVWRWHFVYYGIIGVVQMLGAGAVGCGLGLIVGASLIVLSRLFRSARQNRRPTAA